MIHSTAQTLIIIVMVAIGAMATRCLPFLIFGRKKEIPEVIGYLGKTLPYATIGMLVVYCLKGVTITSKPYGLPELLSILFIIFVHTKKRNTLLSIGLGTFVYMLLIRVL